MSRKRIIDTELYFDSEICDLLNERGLHLYIRLWGIADDSGVYYPNYSDIALKMGALRFTAAETEAFIDSLIKVQKIIPFEIQDTGKSYHWLKNFLNHQTLNNPSVPKLPLPEWISMEVHTYKSGKKFAKFSVNGEKVPGHYQNSTGSLLVDGKSVVTVTSNGNSNGNVTETKEPLSGKPNFIPFEVIINDLNLKTGKTFKHSTRDTRSLIRARWKEGFRLNDFLKVNSTMSAIWIKDAKMSQYLRPGTLYGSKFEGYLNSIIPVGLSHAESKGKSLKDSGRVQAEPDKYKNLGTTVEAE